MASKSSKPRKGPEQWRLGLPRLPVERDAFAQKAKLNALAKRLKDKLKPHVDIKNAKAKEFQCLM